MVQCRMAVPGFSASPAGTRGATATIPGGEYLRHALYLMISWNPLDSPEEYRPILIVPKGKSGLREVKSPRSDHTASS